MGGPATSAFGAAAASQKSKEPEFFMNGCTDEGLFKVGFKELDPWLMMPSRTHSGFCGLRVRLLAVQENDPKCLGHCVICFLFNFFLRQSSAKDLQRSTSTASQNPKTRLIGSKRLAIAGEGNRFCIVGEDPNRVLVKAI